MRISGRALLLPALVLYMGALVLAACPSRLRPQAVDGLGTWSETTLARVGIRAGMPVFSGAAELVKAAQTYYCLDVLGVGRDGFVRLLHPDPPCPRRGVRWSADVFDQTLYHWMYSTRWQSGRRRERLLRALADYYCHSPLVGSRGLTHVILRPRTGELILETGERRDLTRLVYRHACTGRPSADGGDDAGSTATP